MRALWVDTAADCDWVKAHAHGMTALFYAISDPPADVTRRLAESRAKGYAPGVYMAWNWPQFEGQSGFEMADTMHSLVAAVETTATGKVKVQFNNELHDPALIQAMLTRWRVLRPKQDTSWTMEGNQGGWMAPAFVSAVVNAKVRVVPQLYNGAMTQHWDSLHHVRDLTKRGFPDSLVSPSHPSGKCAAS